MPLWDQVEVGEVWMPWTEDPDDPEATRIRSRQSSLALTLTNAFAQDSFTARYGADADGRSSLRAMERNSLTNESAMRTLHRSFSGRPTRRSLSSPETGIIQPPSCAGLSVHVLGPARDEATIRDLDPPSGQSYLRAEAAAPPGPGDVRFAEGPRAQDIRDAAAGVVRDTDLATAGSLDKAVNGTSLMLMFEFGSALLLFPGDAHWGTWQTALDRPAAREMLSRTTFYKVGHHGSHNATPKRFLEEALEPGHRMWGAATSMKPVSFWPEIPRVPLMDALGKRASRVVRSDDSGRSRAGVGVRDGGGSVQFHVP